MNAITKPTATVSDQLCLAVPKFNRPRAHAPNACISQECLPAPDGAFEPLADIGAQAEVSVPLPDNRSKPGKAASELLGMSAVVLFVLGIGTVWAWIVVQVALMLSEMEPLLVRNILWTHHDMQG